MATQPPSPEDRQIAALDIQFFRDDANVRLESLSQFAQAIWKGLTLVNGGAIVALFTVLGNVDLAVDKTKLWWAFAAFAVGLITNLASVLFAYLTQSAYWKQSVHSVWNAQEIVLGRPHKYDTEKIFGIGSKAEWIAFCLAIASLLGFVCGSMFALQGVLVDRPSVHHKAPIPATATIHSDAPGNNRP